MEYLYSGILFSNSCNTSDSQNDYAEWKKQGKTKIVNAYINSRKCKLICSDWMKLVVAWG